MRYHGYCTGCRRVRPIRVSYATLARGGVATGTCSECDEIADVPRLHTTTLLARLERWGQGRVYEAMTAEARRRGLTIPERTRR